MNIQQTIDKADVLVEALPFIQRFRDTIMVIKFGGRALENPELVENAMRDVVLLEAIGIRPVVVHGGGKAISAELKKHDIPVKFVHGLRYTCERTIKIVDDVLHNQVNRNLVELGNACGGRLRGVSGKQVLKAAKTMAVDPVSGKREEIGFVGEIVGVNAAPIMETLNAGFTPIVTPLGTGLDGNIYNINADTAACAIAAALFARKLVFISDVPGILADPKDESTLIPTIRTDEIDGLTLKGILSGGMLPKIAGCVKALNSGINKVHLIDGRVRHALLLEIFTDHGIGTQIVRPDSVM